MKIVSHSRVFLEEWPALARIAQKSLVALQFEKRRRCRTETSKTRSEPENNGAMEYWEARIPNNQNSKPKTCLNNWKIRILKLFRDSRFGLPWRDIAGIHCTRLSIFGASSLYAYVASQVWARDFGF